MKYNLYCAENEEFVFKNAKWNDIKEFGFEIIKDRSESPYAEENDVLSLEFAEVVKKGIENASDEYVTDVLKEWGFVLSTTTN